MSVPDPLVSIRRMKRILVAGWPRVGKTTFANDIGLRERIAVRHTDDLIGLHDWSEASAVVSTWIEDPGPWCIEGVTIPRALRKWLERNTHGAPADVLFWRVLPWEDLTPPPSRHGEELRDGARSDQRRAHSSRARDPSVLMRYYRTADDDGASWRTRERRRSADIAFLETLRAAVEGDDIGRLVRFAEHLDHRHATDWRRIAIARAIAKVTARAHAARPIIDRGHDEP